MNYHNRKFRSRKATSNAQVDSSTVFHYQQTGDIVWADYSGGAITRGHLLGKVDKDGRIEMRYHHVDVHGALMTGRCNSVPEIDESGVLILHETWQWTSGDLSAGTSIIEEVK